MSFSFWLTLLSMIISKSIHIAADGIISFFFMTKIPLYIYVCEYIYTASFFHASVLGHLDCFRVLAFVNNAEMNLEVQVSFHIIVLSGCVPRSGISGSCGNFILSFLRNFHIAFHSGCTNFHSHVVSFLVSSPVTKVNHSWSKKLLREVIYDNWVTFGGFAFRQIRGVQKKPALSFFVF